MTPNTRVTLRLTPELRLKQALTEENPETVTKLTVEGMLTKDDFAYISNFMQTLQELDMDNASIEGNTIEQQAFYKFSGLKSIVIPASVTKIEDNAFYGCTGLTSITLPASVVEISPNAFDECPAKIDSQIDMEDWSVVYSSKEIFKLFFYEGLKHAIKNIPDEDSKDVYICKLFVGNSGSGNEIASVDLQYSTNTIAKAKIGEIRHLSEEYLWRRMPIMIDFYLCDIFLKWRNQIEYKDEDDKYYEFYATNFKDLMVELCKKLFEEEIVLQKFGKNIPFLVECECDEESEIDVNLCRNFSYKD